MNHFKQIAAGLEAHMLHSVPVAREIGRASGSD